VDGEDLGILFGLVRYVLEPGMYRPGVPGTTQNVVNVEQEILSYLQHLLLTTKVEKESLDFDIIQLQKMQSLQPGKEINPGCPGKPKKDMEQTHLSKPLT
tara:strand:+ start:464 stop:763 length:300 start_codon:yes stop_codon:yes gene_type:complete